MHKFGDDFAVFLDADLLRAGAAAFANLPGEAGFSGQHGATVVAVVAGADGEHPNHQIDRFVHRPHFWIRSEIAGAANFTIAGDHHPRCFIGQGDGHKRI